MLTAAPPTALEREPRGEMPGFVHWLRVHPGAVAMGGMLAFAGPLTFFTGALSVMRTPSAVELARAGSWWMLYGLSLWSLLLTAGYGCERLAARLGRPPGGGIWLLAACLAAAVATLLTAGRASVLMQQGLVHSAGTMHLHGFTFSLIMGLMYFAHLRRSREHERAAARLAAAQSAQRHARRRIVEARLQEVQARIDPRVLVEMLENVRRLYEREPGRAERLLDELIVFLRAALPRLRTARPSLARESELAFAFVQLHALSGATDLAMTVDVSNDAMHARFPPGLLLPLLDEAVSRSARPCRLHATRSHDACRVTITLAVAPSPVAIARVQSILAELYGTSATLKIESATGAVNVVVTLPYELA